MTVPGDYSTGSPFLNDLQVAIDCIVAVVVLIIFVRVVYALANWVAEKLIK